MDGWVRTIVFLMKPTASPGFFWLILTTGIGSCFQWQKVFFPQFQRKNSQFKEPKKSTILWLPQQIVFLHSKMLKCAHLIVNQLFDFFV